MRSSQVYKHGGKKMPRKKRIKVKVTKSEWDRAEMPRFALAISMALTDIGRGSPSEVQLNSLRVQIYNQIELALHLEVDKISLVLIEENPPTII